MSDTGWAPAALSPVEDAVMVTQRLDLLDPYEVAQLGGIELTTRGIVEGFLAGLHRSPFRGFSAEFTEHRPYQAGDELRYLDWKVLARADRLTIKQFEAETNLRAMVVLDTSRSMDWRGDEHRLTKLGYAQRLVAALALVLLRQRDATGLLAFDETVRALVPARLRVQQQWALLSTLAALEPGLGTAAEPALRRVTDLLTRRGLVVFVSDLLFERELALRALQYLRHRGHQVIVFHVMDPAARARAGPPEARYEDSESGETVVTRPREIRAAYRETVRRVIDAWRSACRRNGMAYFHVTTDTPFGHVLRRAAQRRARLG
jgi:uncharacterized protein (DUF58 family)